MDVQLTKKNGLTIDFITPCLVVHGRSERTWAMHHKEL